MTFRTLRLRAGFTQYELAAATRALRCAVRQETVSQIELGKVRDPLYSTVRSLARALHLNVEEVGNAILDQKIQRPHPIRRKRPRAIDPPLSADTAQAAS